MSTENTATSPVAFDEINPESDSVIESLGITAARRDELCDALEEIGTANNEGSITAAMSQLSKIAQNPQELSFLNFALGHAVGTSSGFEGVLRRLSTQN